MRHVPTSYLPAIDPDGPVDRTIGEALTAAAATWPERLALVEGLPSGEGRSWTFAGLEQAAHRAASALLDRFQPGDRVAVWATNRPEWLLTQFGAALAGITIVTVNPAYREGELRYVLNQSRANGLVVEPEVRGRDHLAVAEAIREELPELHELISLDDWQPFIGSAPERIGLPAVGPRDPAQIQYTSGTTGFPKGALLAHSGLTLNGRMYAEAIGAAVGDVWVNPMPLFHTAGCGLATLGALQTGGIQVLPPDFDADLMLGLFERYRGTIMLSVPTMLIRMLDAQRDRRRDVAAWRLTTLGGAPVPVELIRRAQRELGVAVGIGFGQTEASPYITHTLPDDPHPQWFETTGRPLPGVAVKISDPATGNTVPAGQTGEICTRGACVMLGYFDDAEGTAKAVDADGWLHTGDLGLIDELGYLKVRGRIKDLIIRGGENIYPREVEDVLYEHPAVVNAAIVGLPDQEWGEVVAAFVQVRPGQPDDGQRLRAELEAHCRERLAGYKIPRVWQFVDELPQTSSGKIQKFVLRDTYAATPTVTSENRPVQ
jgi:acyl-CoA synthetase (AMP-forming)/AMP-acid ligase II